HSHRDAFHAAEIEPLAAARLIGHAGLVNEPIFLLEGRLLSAAVRLAGIITRHAVIDLAPLPGPVRIFRLVLRSGAGRRHRQRGGERDEAERASVKHGSSPKSPTQKKPRKSG